MHNSLGETEAEETLSDWDINERSVRGVASTPVEYKHIRFLSMMTLVQSSTVHSSSPLTHTIGADGAFVVSGLVARCVLRIYLTLSDQA